MWITVWSETAVMILCCPGRPRYLTLIPGVHLSHWQRHRKLSSVGRGGGVIKSVSRPISLCSESILELEGGGAKHTLAPNFSYVSAQVAVPSPPYDLHNAIRAPGTILHGGTDCI